MFTLQLYPAPTLRADGLLQFGGFYLDREQRMLFSHRRKMELRPRIFALLECLMANPGKVMTKNELMDTVWKDADVQEAVLKACLAELRRLLGDSASEPVYIETVYRRGYRFLPAVRGVDRTVLDELSATSAPAAIAW